MIENKNKKEDDNEHFALAYFYYTYFFNQSSKALIQHLSLFFLYKFDEIADNCLAFSCYNTLRMKLYSLWKPFCTKDSSEFCFTWNTFWVECGFYLPVYACTSCVEPP